MQTKSKQDENLSPCCYSYLCPCMKDFHSSCQCCVPGSAVIIDWGEGSQDKNVVPNKCAQIAQSSAQIAQSSAQTTVPFISTILACHATTKKFMFPEELREHINQEREKICKRCNTIVLRECSLQQHMAHHA